MKKFLLALFLVLIAGVAAGFYWYAPAREFAQECLARVGKYAESAVVAQPVPAARETTPAPEAPVEPPVQQAEPAPEVPAEPAPQPEPVDEVPTPESAVEEPEPAPLPVLNAEAEALLPKAEAGDPVAQFNLARHYVLGEGMAVNREEFLRWCRTAAEQGLPEAQFTLGMCYRRGLGVAQDEQEAFRLLQLAADAGFAPAAEQLK